MRFLRIKPRNEHTPALAQGEGEEDRGEMVEKKSGVTKEVKHS